MILISTACAVVVTLAFRRLAVRRRKKRALYDEPAVALPDGPTAEAPLGVDVHSPRHPADG